MCGCGRAPRAPHSHIRTLDPNQSRSGRSLGGRARRSRSASPVARAGGDSGASRRVPWNAAAAADGSSVCSWRAFPRSSAGFSGAQHALAQAPQSRSGGPVGHSRCAAPSSAHSFVAPIRLAGASQAGSAAPAQQRVSTPLRQSWGATQDAQMLAIMRTSRIHCILGLAEAGSTQSRSPPARPPRASASPRVIPAYRPGIVGALNRGVPSRGPHVDPL